MSVSRNCEFLELTPGQWYLLLEDTSAPKNNDGYHDHKAYGPFRFEEDCDEFLLHFPNPGATQTIRYNPSKPLDLGRPENAVLKRLIDAAPKRTRQFT